MKKLIALCAFCFMLSGMLNFPIEDRWLIKKLHYGFHLLLANPEGPDTAAWYSKLVLKKDNKILYLDTSEREYGLTNILYPIILKEKDNERYEILIEVNNRPNRDHALRLFVENGKLRSQDTLPLFIGRAGDINHDGISEYAAYWDDSQVWDDKVAYNPILYYGIQSGKLFLDSNLTITRNTAIYGVFHGYKFDEKIEMPVSVLKKFNKELALWE